MDVAYVFVNTNYHAWLPTELYASTPIYCFSLFNVRGQTVIRQAPWLLLALNVYNWPPLETQFANDEVSASSYPSDMWSCSWAVTETNGQTFHWGLLPLSTNKCTHINHGHIYTEIQMTVLPNAGTLFDHEAWQLYISVETPRGFLLTSTQSRYSLCIRHEQKLHVTCCRNTLFAVCIPCLKE